jgi:hypothetical protein
MRDETRVCNEIHNISCRGQIIWLVENTRISYFKRDDDDYCKSRGK